MTATIKTNNRPRELMSLLDFPLERQQKIRSDFDWMGDIETTQGFFKYHGMVYHLEEFLRVTSGWDEVAQHWDGVAADSYFTGTLVRLCDDPDFVIVGRYAT